MIQNKGGDTILAERNKVWTISMFAFNMMVGGTIAAVTRWYINCPEKMIKAHIAADAFSLIIGCIIAGCLFVSMNSIVCLVASFRSSKTVQEVKEVPENFPFWTGRQQITFDEAVFGHRHLWSWVGTETQKNKKIVKPEDYFSCFKHVEVPRNNKYCCEYAEEICENCPIKWNEIPLFEIPCYRVHKEGTESLQTTPYCQWLEAVQANDYEAAAEAAFHIADLPTREIARGKEGKIK